MKNTIQKFFAHDRTYQGGVNIYMQYGTSQSFRKQLNLQEQNTDLQSMLFEELRTMGEITPIQFTFIMAAAVQPLPVVMEEPQPPFVIPVIPSPIVKDPANQAKPADARKKNLPGKNNRGWKKR